MGIVTYEGQIESPVPPVTLFKMMVVEDKIYLPKVMPQAIMIVETLAGDGGPGTLKQVTFAEGSPITHVRETVDFIDEKNFTYHYSIVGGDPALIDTSKFEKLSFEFKMEATLNGGTIAERSCKGYTIDGVEVDEEEVRASLAQNMQGFYGAFKTFEAYALANPDA